MKVYSPISCQMDTPMTHRRPYREENYVSLIVLQEEEDGLEEDPFAGIGEDPLALDDVKQEPMDIQVSLSLSLLSHSQFSLGVGIGVTCAIFTARRGCRIKSLRFEIN